ncbi:Yip1-domain-containing protein [Aulographum hederae CBS 113979]|uniref:Protein YIP n=1 Tax=Aulographum hederae CBS 113979 TaxID=1176131 RepID=A0A6G1GP64_9PEZI|nr:Yip1-domain-containing protein [Aulographum hederae CBS 113979]
MAAMMPSSSTANNSNPYSFDHSNSQNDLIDPDDATLDDLDDPLAQASSSDRAPLTGNISSQPGRRDTQNYLTSQIGGEDRRAAASTIDESVWETLSRDLRAVWEKMRQVLWPKYLLGGMLVRERGGGIAGAERGEGGGATGAGAGLERLRGAVGTWPDAETVLQGAMSEGLRDWDLWGPLLFSLLLSTLLSWRAKDEQTPLVFSGVFAIVWIGEAVVTLQIKLLGGNVSFLQSICIIGYTLFPLVIAALLSAFHLHWIARIPVYIVLVLWSLAAGVSILGGSGVVRNRVGIAVYPLFVFYVGLGCLCYIS